MRTAPFEATCPICKARARGQRAIRHLYLAPGATVEDLMSLLKQEIEAGKVKPDDRVYCTNSATPGKGAAGVRPVLKIAPDTERDLEIRLALV